MVEDDDKGGKAAGGHARAEALPPEERSKIASYAAKKRWSEKRAREQSDGPQGMPRVLEGYASTLDLVGVKIPCAVIEGPSGVVRVLSEHGITQAILGSRSGASKRLKKALEESGESLPIFVAPKQVRQFITPAMLDGPLKPIDYWDGTKIVRSYEASILTDVCNVWLEARANGALQQQQLAKAQSAELLTRALAETGVIALVDEATGYQHARPQNALQEYLKHVIREQLAAWVKKFPDEFFENIYKIRGWPWPGMKKNRYSVVGQYIRDLVYDRLGPGVLAELERKSPKDENGNRPNKLHQWLTVDIGDPMLAQHLHTLIMFQRLAIKSGYGWQRFVQTVDQVLPRKGATLELPLNDPRAAAAFLAIWLRCFFDKASALAFPPLSPPMRPRATAAGFLPSSVLGSAASPVATSAMNLASWFVSRGRFGLLMRSSIRG
jgi:P63C domain.